ncbi:hypothetical protein MAR_004832 [Mya arenaria]|uniref:DUF4371 domain-containing protein n=1 Tax=Mya arenaria TaxID=6604 RepID=A0ABY7F0V1_MYAAR|nr:hypothetical protein MAR_004832 [Mya arenaria]
MDRTTASYKFSHGMAPRCQQKLVNKLQSSLFSVVSYFALNHNEVVVRHLQSFKVVKADAESIFRKIETVLEQFHLSWENQLYALLDSCNTMRGKKSGVETRIRENAPHLLDIDGDSVHHAHNAAKAFTGPFSFFLETLFNTIHSFSHTAFISAYNLAVDTSRLLDAYSLLLRLPSRMREENLQVSERRAMSDTSREQLEKNIKKTCKEENDKEKKKQERNNNK